MPLLPSQAFPGSGVASIPDPLDCEPTLSVVFSTVGGAEGGRAHLERILSSRRAVPA